MTPTLVASGRPLSQRVGSFQFPFTGSFQRVTSSAGSSATTTVTSNVPDCPDALAARNVKVCEPAASWSGFNSSSIVPTPLELVFTKLRDFREMNGGGRLVGE